MRFQYYVVRASLILSLVPSSVSGLQIGPLLSTCVDACQRGCNEIRAVHASRDEVGLKVELKDAADPRSALTEADGAAQMAIVGALRAEWGPELRIVGEEDDDDELSAAIENTKFEPLKRDMFDDDIGETAEIDASEISVFVDPLDGTREFVEGRVANCQSLIGISIGGEAIAGVIGIPFPAGDLSTDSTIIYGLEDIGSGVIGAPLTRGPFPLDHHIDGLKYPRPHHATGDSSAEVMKASRRAAIQKFGGSNVIYGGAGNKILGAALGEVASSIQHKVGGPWDIAAPSAVLKSMGGKITNMFGDEIDLRDDRCHEKGYIATPPNSDNNMFHDALVAAMQAQPEFQEYKKQHEKKE
jgi:3'-phosphoadenosine 5'-phosphosulfate (PAPS) 3'-phosphatase